MVQADEGGRSDGREPPPAEFDRHDRTHREWQVAMLDGPYVVSKEQLSGYFSIDVADLNAAISWAAHCPAASHGVVQVRPLWGTPA